MHRARAVLEPLAYRLNYGMRFAVESSSKDNQPNVTGGILTGKNLNKSDWEY